ncbi:MAG: ABC-F family ATP-binding cassette domain-containing protein [Bacteroidales bacterium]
MFSVNNLSVQFSGNFLFQNVSFIINKNSRIGLVGKNGSGKSTLMKILAGLQKPESGEIAKPAEGTVGYLPQEIFLSSDKLILEETMTAFHEAQSLEKKIDTLTKEIASRQDYESEDYKVLINKLSEANERLDIIGGHTKQARAEKVLLGLGFKQSDFTRPMAEFSGGWQMRVELAKILLRNPDLLLLDEPTNHLDIESIQWLENFLISYSGAVMLVSHDRAFLDNITTRTIEISMQKVYDYKAAYSRYEEMRRERLEHETAAFNNQQREIAQAERFIERFRAKATKARQAQSKIKLLEKIERIEIEELDSSSIHFKFPEAPASGKIALEVKNVSKSYGNNQVLDNINFIIGRGERIAFVGKNGEGKTTLSRIIVNDLDYEGKVNIGHNVKIGYYAQNQSEFLNPGKTVFQTLDDIAVGEVRKQIRNILGGFLFSDDDVDKKVSVLSGGEKSRLAIAKLLLQPVNLLVLDEPTNHLDMQSKDILKRALLQFNGTVIIVSHDRDFLQGLSEKVFEFKNKRIKEFIGDVYDFINLRKVSSLDELNLSKQKGTNITKSKDSENKKFWEEKKSIDSEIRKLQNKIEKVEEEIEKIETEKKAIEQIIANPDNNELLNDNTIFDKYESIKEKLSELENSWEKHQIELEKFNSK